MLVPGSVAHEAPRRFLISIASGSGAMEISNPSLRGPRSGRAGELTSISFETTSTGSWISTSPIDGPSHEFGFKIWSGARQSVPSGFSVQPQSIQRARTVYELGATGTKPSGGRFGDTRRVLYSVVPPGLRRTFS